MHSTWYGGNRSFVEMWGDLMITTKEAIEYLSGRYLVVGSKCNPPEDECKKHNKVVDMAIRALEIASDLKERNIDLETIKNYIQFEDECIKKNFTFKSILEAREKQIAKKPVPHPADHSVNYCPNCGKYFVGLDCAKYCWDCGQKLDWE